MVVQRRMGGRKLRILFTSSGYRVGGATMAMMHLAMGLAKLGHEPLILTSKPAPKYSLLFDRLRRASVRVISSGRDYRSILYWVWLFFKTIQTARAFGVDVVHCHGTKETVVVGAAAKLARKPVLYTLEGDPLIELQFAAAGTISRLFMRVLLSLGIWLADRVAACSNWLAAHFRARYRVDAVGVWNPIDYDRFSVVEGSGSASPVVLFVGRLERVKGVETLLYALGELKKAGRGDVVLCLVGEGGLRGHLERLSKELGVNGNVVFTGHVDDVARYLERSWVFVLPSLYEPFGMAAAEASAAGRPVIASSVGGLREVVKEGGTGYLFRPGDYRELSRLLMRVLDDAELRRRLGERGREYAKEFSSKRIAERYTELYLSILTHGQGQGRYSERHDAHWRHT
ncbi:N-acetyl-alpha-D-glucosaminyl L-malate synthase [Candidatus Calditenuaceae archaeon HR02]|nr:N-acetyl-alpha-D-glucosaminyl L-malate synthase [Candidatus Calditenuaceae archaeon HR02]